MINNTMHNTKLLFETVLYRGDSTRIDAFDFGMTDLHALLGQGIYLTDDPAVALDYTVKQSRDLVFSSDTARNEKELVSAYLHHMVINDPEWKTAIARLQDEWRSKHYTREMSSEQIYAGYKVALRDLFKTFFSMQKKKWLSSQSQFRILKTTVGEWKIVNAARGGHISSFDIPEFYLNKTLHADRPLSDADLTILRDIFKSVFTGNVIDMRDSDEKFLSFDGYVDNFKTKGTRYAWTERPIGGKGQNPSFDELLNGTHAGYHVMHELSHQRNLISRLQAAGYVGLEYDGGVRISGTGTRGGGRNRHRAFVLWDDAFVNAHRLTNSVVRDPDIDPNLGRHTRPKYRSIG